jgi:hypothetical protein
LSALVFTARSGLAAHVPLPWLFSLSGALPTSNQVLHAGSVPFLGAVFGVGGRVVVANPVWCSNAVCGGWLVVGLDQRSDELGNDAGLDVLLGA